MEPAMVRQLEAIVGKDQVVTNRENMLNYLSDETPVIVRPEPASNLVLVKPVDACQVAAILRFANDHKASVFPRGGGTGLVGGAVPTRDGIIVSLELMNRIEIDRENMMAVAQAGVSLGRLMRAADEQGLSFPPHPGDENAQVGGLVATNAGGSRAVRHGVMRNHVRGLNVVLPTGELLKFGGKVHKNNVGYDLMQLIIGSEGTLGIVTEATIQLYRKSGASITLVVPFPTRPAAIGAVPGILREAGTPLAIEYVERDLMERTAKHLGRRWPLSSGGDYYLIIIVAESTRDEALALSLKISEICKGSTSYDVFAAESANDQENILAIRSNIYTALKPETLEILDITVPISELENIVTRIQDIEARYSAPSPVFGHAGDGNLHVHIMRKPDGDTKHVESLSNEIYQATAAVGGVITGEHGIGKIRTQVAGKFLDQKEIELMKGMKRLFDPNNILNPETKLPS
jgi:glycolate oxidase